MVTIFLLMELKYKILLGTTFLPKVFSLEFYGDPTPDTIQVLIDFKEASYSGGGNITFKGTLEDNDYFTTRLFQGEVLLGHSPVHFTYSVKTDGNSLIGLSLQFSSVTKEKKSVLVGSKGHNLFSKDLLSRKFSKVIKPRQVTKPEITPGWVTEESSIAMDGYTLEEIHVVCYRSKPKHNESGSSNGQDNSLVCSPSEYFAVLGHLLVKTSEQNLVFPPSTSWVVEGQFVKWTSGSQNSKTLSVKIIWKLKEGGASLFPQYNIYVEKLEGVQEYLGVAKVEAFYVSDLVVPSGTSSLKFIIQVCSFDGTCQKLDDSPFFQLHVEGSNSRISIEIDCESEPATPNGQCQVRI